MAGNSLGCVAPRSLDALARAHLEQNDAPSQIHPSVGVSYPGCVKRDYHSIRLGSQLQNRLS